MENLYTTPEAAKSVGIPESTIRSWLRRHPEVFHLDVHLVADEHGRKLWTDAGIELLRSRAPESATDDVAESDAETGASNLLESLLDHDSRQLAREYWRQLPARTLHRIAQMYRNPTEEDRQIVAASVRSALNAGTSHLLLPVYQPMFLGGGDEQATNED